MDCSKECDPTEQVEIHLLLEGIYRRYGHDFRQYRFSSIRRRVWHRIDAENLSSIGELQHRLLRSPALMNRLFEDFTIEVTTMFRDPLFFRTLRRYVVPHLHRQHYSRIWHAGCSTGEEVLSMGILLREEGLQDRVKLYATDANERLLETARQGVYDQQAEDEFSRNYRQAGGLGRLNQYFEINNNSLYFHKQLIKDVVYAHHNLVTDHSFNEFDLIVCRNVLIYFNKELQRRTHQLFLDSLAPNGFLALGQKECVLPDIETTYYQLVSLNQRIYRRTNQRG